MMFWRTLKTWAHVVCAPLHLTRTVLIALAVGTWLNLFNHGDELLRGKRSNAGVLCVRATTGYGRLHGRTASRSGNGISRRAARSLAAA